jgi:hypothetical protein
MLEKKGYFLFPDGTKSCDVRADPKKKYGNDVVLPARVKSAYSYFMAENSAKVKE